MKDVQKPKKFTFYHEASVSGRRKDIGELFDPQFSRHLMEC